MLRSVFPTPVGPSSTINVFAIHHGISAAKRIREYDKNTLIIYVTSHENHMQESFEVRPFRFLVKPVSEKLFETCFKSAYEEVYCGDSYFRYSYQRVNHKIPMREILYFESNRRKVSIVTEKDTFVAYGKDRKSVV